MEHPSRGGLGWIGRDGTACSSDSLGSQGTFRSTFVCIRMNVSTSAASAVSEVRKPSPFTSGTAIVMYVALVRIVLYFFAGPHYGYFRDELYYLACGEHPAWGYVDQPPLIAWIAWFLQHTIGTSLWALRLLPALAGASTVILAGLLARELAGRRWAMFLASLAALMAPVLLAMSHLFTMNAFDPLLWTGLAYLVVHIARDGSQPLWLVVGALTGITILNKYAVLFWLAGVVIGICLTGLRSSLRHRWFWLGCALATAIAAPNFLWQWRHHFPFLELMHNVRAEGRDILLPPLPYLQAQAQMLGFVAALLVLFALLFFFSRPGRPYRALGWAYLIFLAEMMALRARCITSHPSTPCCSPPARCGWKAPPNESDGSGPSRRWPWPSLPSPASTRRQFYPFSPCPTFSPTNTHWASSSSSSSTCSRVCFPNFTQTCSAGRRWRSGSRPTITRFLRRNNGRPPSMPITMARGEPSTSLDRSMVFPRPSEATRTTGSGGRAITPVKARSS